MPHEIFKRPQAERDIEECFVYIAEDELDTRFVFWSLPVMLSIHSLNSR